MRNLLHNSDICFLCTDNHVLMVTDWEEYRNWKTIVKYWHFHVAWCFESSHTPVSRVLSCHHMTLKTPRLEVEMCSSFKICPQSKRKTLISNRHGTKNNIFANFPCRFDIHVLGYCYCVQYKDNIGNVRTCSLSDVIPIPRISVDIVKDSAPLSCIN